MILGHDFSLQGQNLVMMQWPGQHLMMLMWFCWWPEQHLGLQLVGQAHNLLASGDVAVPLFVEGRGHI